MSDREYLALRKKYNKHILTYNEKPRVLVISRDVFIKLTDFYHQPIGMVCEVLPIYGELFEWLRGYYCGAKVFVTKRSRVFEVY